MLVPDDALIVSYKVLMKADYEPVCQREFLLSDLVDAGHDGTGEHVHDGAPCLGTRFCLNGVTVWRFQSFSAED